MRPLEIGVTVGAVTSSTSSPEAVAAAIQRYVPRRVHVRDRLGADGFHLVRRAVTAAAPVDVHSARVLCSYVAAHVAWALGSGWAAQLDEVFCAKALRQRTLELGELHWVGTSPTELSEVERVSRLVAPLAGHTPVLTIRRSAISTPYSASDEALLLNAVRTFKGPDLPSTIAGLGIGAGAGVVGPNATAVSPEMVVDVDGQLLVADASTGIWVPIDRWWARHVGAALAVRDQSGVGPLTTLFTKLGAARVQGRLRRDAAVPEIDPFRLRATWLTRLLGCDLPIDVVAAAAGMSVARALQYDATLNRRHSDDDLVRLLSGTDLALRPPSVDPFGGLPRIDPLPELGEVESVESRLARYQPQDPRAAEVWNGPVGRAVTSLILGMTNDWHRGFDLASAFCALARWAVDQPGVPLRVEVLLQESLIQRHAASCQAAGEDPRNLGPRRNQLRMLSKALQAAPAQPRPPVRRSGFQGYSAGAVAKLRAAAAALVEGAETTLAAALVIGAGTGSSVEVGYGFRCADLRIADGVAFVLRKGQWIPVAAPYLVDAERLTQSATGGTLLTERRIARTRAALFRTSGVRLTSVALRHTWVLEQLRRNVPALPCIARRRWAAPNMTAPAGARRSPSHIASPERWALAPTAVVLARRL
jgi:hypothetical protein